MSNGSSVFNYSWSTNGNGFAADVCDGSASRKGLEVCAATQNIPATLAPPAFLQSYVASLVTAAVRLVPLGQTDGQLGIAELEPAVLAVASQAEQATIHDLGSAAFMVDLASASHETQYTRLFRS